MEWQIFKRGVTAESVLQQLIGTRARLNEFSGALSPDPVLAANTYLRWTEDAERVLRQTLSTTDLVEALYTRRYWYIREISPDTPRPFPLIGDEITVQLATLASAISQVEHYARVLGGAGSPSLVLLDTNVLVHGRQFQDVSWHSEFQRDAVTVVLPLIVIDELDKLKDKGVRPAGSVLKALDGFLDSGEVSLPIRVRDGVHLQVVDEPFLHKRLDRADDELARQANYFQSFRDDRVLVVTRDRGMRVRCQARNVEAVMLPDRLERSPEERSTHE
jgi:rRNA-processing protein FCF1